MSLETKDGPLGPLGTIYNLLPPRERYFEQLTQLTQFQIVLLKNEYTLNWF